MADSSVPSNPAAPLLGGLRVVEIGHHIAAPLAGMLMAEQGAEVVRVVNAARPSNEPVLDALLARGKTEITLDPGHPEGSSMLHRLIDKADVVVTNEPHGGMEAWGIRFENIRKHSNPGLVSCSIPAFPAFDPRTDSLDYEALAGMAGYLYEPLLGSPKYHELPIGSVMAGLYGTNAVIAALIARERMGRGQHVDTSLFQADIFAQILQVLIKTGVPRGFLPMKMIGTPFVKSWLCKDQRYIYLHITLPAHTAHMLTVLDRMGYTADAQYLRSVLSQETLRDPSQVKSIGEAKKIRSALEKIFLTKSAQEWEELIGEELCCVKVRTVDEWLRDCRATGMTDVSVVDDPEFGELFGPGPQVVSPDHPPLVKARRKGRDAAKEILTRWEAEPSLGAQVARAGKAPVELRHPLEGYRVLDISRVIAGPCAARVLAEFGAEVILVQNPTNLDWTLAFHLVFNAGKKSVSLNFTNDEGKKKLWALMKNFQPHAFIQNYRHLDVAKAVGVDPEAMFAQFPDLVYTHLNAYGNEGGWRDRPGFEQVVQAVSGIQMAYGTGGKPKLVPTPIIDIGSGLSGALATLLGIYYRERTGEGAFSATHLTSSSVLFQLHKVAEYQHNTCLQRAKAKGAAIHFTPGGQIISAILKAKDGFVAVAGPWKDLGDWFTREGLLQGVAATPDHLWESVRKAFKRKTLAEWRQGLSQAGLTGTVGLMPYRKLKMLTQEISKFDPRPVPMARKRTFPGVPTDLTFVSSPVSLSVTPMKDVTTPSQRGGDTQEVLARIGENLPPGAGSIPYPENKPFLVWAMSFVRWAYFAWKAGNI